MSSRFADHYFGMGYNWQDNVELLVETRIRSLSLKSQKETPLVFTVVVARDP